jgi:hypothetical protein
MIYDPLRRPQRADRDSGDLRNRFLAETLAACHVGAANRDFGSSPELGAEFRYESCQMKSGVGRRWRGDLKRLRDD